MINTTNSIMPQTTQGVKGLLEQALELAAKGYPVFPLRPNSKEPSCANGFHTATTDLEQIRQWWRQNPNYNIGIAAPELLVVDVDDPEQFGAGTKQTLFGDFVPPELPVVQTAGGGYHYYMRVDPDWATEWGIGNNVGVLPGIDLKGCGRGYVVGPGSVVAGRSYELVGGWSELPPVAELPLIPEQTRRAIEQTINNRKPSNGNGNGHSSQPLPNHTTVDLPTLERGLLRIWTRGRRQALALAISGMLRKLGYDEPTTAALLGRVATAAGDEEQEKRMDAVRDTYAGERIAGWTLLTPDEQDAIAPALRQNPRQLRQNRATDAEPSGTDNLTTTQESHATTQPGANTAPPRKPTRPAPQPWQTQRPKQTADTGGTESADTGERESADTVGTDGGVLGSSLAGEAARPVLAALEDHSGELSPLCGDSTPSSTLVNIVRPNETVTKSYSPCNKKLQPVKQKATTCVTKSYNICNEELHHLTVAEMILAHVSDRGSITLADLLALTGCSEPAARQALRRLVRAGKLVRRGSLYFLPSADETEGETLAEYARRNGISEVAARVRLKRLVDSGRALRLARGLYFVLPDNWQLVTAEWNPCAVRRDQRGREYYELELCEPIGSVQTIRFYMNETRYNALCAASEILGLERRSCRIAVARKFRGGRSVYDCVAIVDKSGSRLLWREREKD